jgi:hypothetical protein
MKRTVYFRIARENTPSSVAFVRLTKSSDPYLGLAHLDDEDWIEAPIPNTLSRLFTFIHECSHIRRCHFPTTETYTRCEAEANLDAFRIFDREGLSVPLRSLKRRRTVFLGQILRDEREGTKRHRTVTRCLNEFDRRIAKADAGNLYA